MDQSQGRAGELGGKRKKNPGDGMNTGFLQAKIPILSPSEEILKFLQ